mgnify:CR=1 FL=1
MDTTTITFTQEPLVSVWDEAMALAPAHWMESALLLNHPQQMNRALYDALEANGSLRCFAARDDGRLIGYASYLLSPSLHAAGIQASQDTVYLDPSVRGRKIGSEFLQWIEADLMAAGVTAIYQHAADQSPMAGYLRHHGYRETHRLFVKEMVNG